MKKLLQFSMILLGLAIASPMNAQRYLTEIFDEYQVMQDVNFGVNVQPLFSSFPTNLAEQAVWQSEMDTLNNLILYAAVNNPDTISSPIYAKWFYPNGSFPGQENTMVKITPLTMDIYLPPASDEVTNRPTFVYLHTGNFLPALYNGAITGDKRDSVGVNICKQMAMRGYVVAAINYRLGWQPLSTNENTRKGTLLQAVYRSILDAQTAVRYLKVLSPVYGVDPTKISLFGTGSGGYTAVAYATLNDYASEVALDKFLDSETQVPFVVESVDGTLDGGPGFLRLIDPLQGLVDKNICMSVNMGGALADSSWLNAGEPPMVTFQCVRDPYAPFDHGMVVVPTTNENVVEVDGGNIFIQRANNLGNNDAFANIPDGDVYTDAARATYGVTYDYIYATQPTMTVKPSPEGLYPFIKPLNGDVSVFGNQGSPWDWWDYNTLVAVVAGTNAAQGTTFDADALNASGLFSNPDMSVEQGLAYIDTVQNYLHPRVVLACNLVTGIAENPAIQSAMDIFPNPASSTYVTIRNEKAQMSEIVIMDALGKIVLRTNVNAFEYRLNHEGWKSGMYFVTVLFEEGGQMTKKLVLK